MNKSIKIIFLIISTFLFPMSIDADCIDDYEAIKDEFKVTYKYNKDTDDFTISLANPDYTKYGYGFIDEYDYTGYMDNGALVKTVSNYKEDTYFYLIVGRNENCNGMIFKQEEKKLYKYNEYSDNPLCDGFEDFVLCQKEYDKEIDEETFKSRLETYKKTKEENNNNYQNKNENSEINNETAKNIWKNIIDYIKENLIVVIIVIVFIIIAIISIALTIKSVIKSRRLE